MAVINFTGTILTEAMIYTTINVKRAVLQQGGPRDAAVNFDTYQILQRHRAVSLPQHAFFVGLCLQSAMNYLPTGDKYQNEPVRSHS